MSRAKAVTHSHGARRGKGIDLALIDEQFAKLERAIEQAITDAYRKGHTDGVREGKRLAKGKYPYAKARGRQKVLHDILALQFVRQVDSLLNKHGVSLGAAVAEYLNVMAPAWKALDERKPSQGALMRLYQRVKKGKAKIDVSMRHAYEQLERDRSST
jgi:hypothetical protein